MYIRKSIGRQKRHIERIRPCNLAINNNCKYTTWFFLLDQQHCASLLQLAVTVSKAQRSVCIGNISSIATVLQLVPQRWLYSQTIVVCCPETTCQITMDDRQMNCSTVLKHACKREDTATCSNNHTDACCIEQIGTMAYLVGPNFAGDHSRIIL